MSAPKVTLIESPSITSNFETLFTDSVLKCLSVIRSVVGALSADLRLSTITAAVSATNPITGIQIVKAAFTSSDFSSSVHTVFHNQPREIKDAKHPGKLRPPIPASSVQVFLFLISSRFQIQSWAGYFVITLTVKSRITCRSRMGKNLRSAKGFFKVRDLCFATATEERETR